MIENDVLQMILCLCDAQHKRRAIIITTQITFDEELKQKKKGKWNILAADLVEWGGAWSGNAANKIAYAAKQA